MGVSEPARGGDAAETTGRFVPAAPAVAAAGYSSCVAVAPEGSGRGAATPLSQSRSRRGPQWGRGRGSPSAEPLVPAASQGVPS